MRTGSQYTRKVTDPILQVVCQEKDSPLQPEVCSYERRTISVCCGVFLHWSRVERLHSLILPKKGEHTFPGQSRRAVCQIRTSWRLVNSTHSHRCAWFAYFHQDPESRCCPSSGRGSRSLELEAARHPPTIPNYSDLCKKRTANSGGADVQSTDVQRVQSRGQCFVPISEERRHMMT